MNSLLRRTAAVAGATCLAVTIPFVTALPAQADADDCANYLEVRGYRVGSGVMDACAGAAEGSVGGVVACPAILLGLGVRAGHAGEACDRAQN